MTAATCRVCAGPLTAVSDDPDLSHPSCAPADRERFEAATHGPRTYRGVLRAIHWSTCPCGQRIDEGAPMWLMDTAAGRRWVCSETCPAVSTAKPSDRSNAAAPRDRNTPDFPASTAAPTHQSATRGAA